MKAPVQVVQAVAVRLSVCLSVWLYWVVCVMCRGQGQHSSQLDNIVLSLL